MNNNPVVHFEMPYEDKERLVNFYKDALGWDMQDQGSGMDNYIVAVTTETKDGRPTTPGAINGGFFAKKPDWPAQYPSVVIAVENVDEAMKRIRDAGGEVLGEPMDIDGIGRYVSFTDSEGNRVSIMKPIPPAQS